MTGGYLDWSPPAETRRPDEIVNGYLDAIGARDFERARRFLADRGFSNRSPISTFDDADAFVADLSRVGAILERMERRRVFVDGNEVCVILDYVTHMHRRQVTPVVHWMRTVNGKIAAIETFFDARVYEELFELGV
jgi:ketosteroid isomerase-like protein